MNEFQARHSTYRPCEETDDSSDDYELSNGYTSKMNIKKHYSVNSRRKRQNRIVIDMDECPLQKRTR